MKFNLKSKNYETRHFKKVFNQYRRNGKIFNEVKAYRNYLFRGTNLQRKTPEWGDVDPVTKKLTGNYGSKYTGAVTKKESLITEENGFEKTSTILKEVRLVPSTSEIASIKKRWDFCKF